MLQEGDSYVHFTKYGGVNIGQVKEVRSSTVIDTVNKVKYFKHYIITNKEVLLSLDGEDGRIYLLKEIISEEEALAYSRMVLAMKMKKDQIIEEKLKLPKLP